MASETSPPHARALAGHVPATSALSPRRAFERLSRVVRPLVAYARADPWDADTDSLPKPLADYRRRVRDFAQRHLGPRSLSADLDPHPAPGDCHPGNREL